MTIEELITVFRKETEDLVQANVRAIYKRKYGETPLIVGENIISFPVEDNDTAYASAGEYSIRLLKAMNNDVSIVLSLEIRNKTASGFTVYTPRDTVLHWETFLLYPDFSFHT